MNSYNSLYLFPTDSGHVTASSVQQSMRRLALKSGLDGIRLSPHMLRHTCATLMITKGANVYAVKDILGHCSLQTTLKYTHLQLEDIKNQHNKYSPVEYLKIQLNKEISCLARLIKRELYT
ncbi:tyrosine-type recombinase/integrase [Chloroflexota bacterium]